MRKPWTGVALVVGLAVAGPVAAQTLPPGPASAPTPEPIPCAPSGTGVPQAMIPPAGGGMSVSPLSLPGDTMNAFVKPPPTDDGHSAFYFGFDYLLWWANKDRVPVLVSSTTADPPDITRTFGAFFQHETVPLLGGSGLQAGGLNGARFTAGIAPSWFLPMEFSIFTIGNQKLYKFQSDANGESILIARPVTAVQLPINNQVSYLAAFPELVRGGVRVDTSTNLWGFQANVFAEPLTKDFDMKGVCVDLLFGFRYLSLNEQIDIANSAYSLSPLVQLFFAGNTVGQNDIVFVRDSFRAYNTFAGGQVGTRANFSIGCFNVQLLGNLAVGKTFERIRNVGLSTNYQLDGPAITVPSGILAVPSNMGTYSRDEYAVIPEGAVTLELPVCGWFRAYVGYNILYWSNVVRPGPQINTNVDTRQVATDIDNSPSSAVSQPAFSFHHSDFWAQGLTAGFAITY